jgi:hypothetical protein
MSCNKIIIKKAIIVIFFGILLSDSKGQNINKSNTVNWEMKVVSGSNMPVIDKNHPGAKDNLHGFENGDITKLEDGSYHMVITELFDTGWSIPARIGHWKSIDKGDTWVRLGTIVQGNNIPKDPKMDTWSAHWYYDSVKNMWNIIWRGYQAIFRYASDKNGNEGINSTYSEASQFIPPFYGTKKWWDWPYPDSFSNIFIAANGQYYAFVGNGFIGNGKIVKADGDWNWYVGLATAKNIDGPWYRDDLKIDPDFSFAENPIVINEGGTYFAVFDDLLYKKSIGYAYSTDGIHWTQKSLDLTDYIPWVANHKQISKADPSGLGYSLRTPCSLKKEGDNYVIIFTGYNDNNSYWEVGKLIVSLNPS